MKVLHIITGTETGGAEGMLHRLLIGLRAKGVTQTVISLAPLGPMATVMRASGFEVRSAELRSFRNLPRALWLCCKWIRDFKPEVVQTWMYHADLIGGVAARTVGVSRVVWGLRRSHVVERIPLASRFVMHLCALTSRFIPKHIVAAAEDSRPAHLALGYTLSHLTVIPNGFEIPPEFDSAERRSAREILGVPASAILVVGAVGRFAPVKDQPTLLEAFARIVHSGRQVHLVLIGPGCDHANPILMDLLARLGLQSLVTLAGERQHARKLLPAFDLYCLSSRSEGFPNVVGEAMAAGVPCVVTDVGDAALLLGDTGVVVPPADPLSLATGLQRLLDAPTATRQALGARARDRIEKEYSIARAADRYFRLYTDLIAAGGHMEKS